MPFLFSYGTLQKQNVQLQLFGRILTGRKDILQGYRMATIEITDEKFLSKGEQKVQQTLIATNNNIDFIEGTALELSEEELRTSDQYEPGNYKRKKVKLQSGKEAWVYLAG